MYPLIWLVINSLKSNNELFTNPWGFGASIQINNYLTAWTAGKIGVSFLNSALVSVSSVGITILVSSMAAFALTRLKWKLSGPVLSLFLLGVRSRFIQRDSAVSISIPCIFTNRYIALYCICSLRPPTRFLSCQFYGTFSKGN